MPEQRMILQKRPQHHKHRLMAAVILSGLGVASIWAWQMKTTFKTFAAEREAAHLDDAFTQAKENVESSRDAAEIQDSVNVLQGLMSDLLREEAVKEEVLDQVAEDMKAEMDGAVAGEATEIN